MKKFVVICAVIFNCLLYAETGKGQLEQLNFFLKPFERGVEICKEKGFTHFLVRKMTYEDHRGQSLAFKGILDLQGDAILSETITEKFDPPVGRLTVKCEFVFFKNHPLAIESSKHSVYLANIIPKLLIPKTVQQTMSLEEAIEMSKEVNFPDDSEVRDQLAQFASVLLLPFRTVLPRVLTYDYKYFLIKKIAFKDHWGQSLLFKGLSDVEGGVLVSNNQTAEYPSPVDTINVESEIFFFDKLPKEPLVIDVYEWLNRNENSEDK